MQPQQATIWYRRMSALYALGAWTLLGSLFVFGRKKHSPPDGEVEQRNISTHQTAEHPEGFYVETVVTYREDFVPITDKILNYLKSWTGGPGSKS